MAEDATLGMAVLLFVGGTTALLMRQCAERIEQDRHFSTPWVRIAFTLAVLVGFVFLFAKVAHVFRPR